MRKDKMIRAMGKLQVRESEEPADMRIEGQFIVFNSETELWPGLYEQIAHGSIENFDDDIRALADHDTAKVLGRTKAGTLELKQDEKGLFGIIHINPKDSEAVNLYHRVQRGDITECSFGFTPTEEKVEFVGDDMKITVTKLTLHEVSVVAFPAYEGTGVEARAKQAQSARNSLLQERKKKMKERLAC